MNARSYRQAYDKPYVLEIQRQRSARLGRPPGSVKLTDEGRLLAARRHREKRNRQLAVERSRKWLDPAKPVKAEVVHQCILTVAPPLRGSIAFQCLSVVLQGLTQKDLSRVDGK